MTNKEAIIVLKNIAWFGKIYDQEQTEEAAEMAIHALTAQESCNQLATNLQPCKQEDFISRQTVIDVLDRNRILGQGLLNDTLDHIADAIMALPSAQPLVLTCDGCRHVGTYDTDFPCSGCIRREKDYYEQE